MNVTNELLPTTPEQRKEMMKPGPDGPIFMVNLLKFKEKAEYEDGRSTELSGRDAYRLYAMKVMELLPQYGGKPVFFGDVTFLAVGQADELWDEVAVVMYPKRADMVRMSMSNEWREISAHRTAGLAGQLNIETVAPTAANVR